jgi:hypothetical protein
MVNRTTGRHYPVSKRFGKSFPSLLESMTSFARAWIADTTPEWSGQFQRGLAPFTNLRVLAIDNNALNGNISTEIGNLSSMRFLLLETNNLDGTIPTEFGQ